MVTYPAGTTVTERATGHRGVTVDDSMVVRNSETDVLTATNLVRFEDGSEWIRRTDALVEPMEYCGDPCDPACGPDLGLPWCDYHAGTATNPYA